MRKARLLRNESGFTLVELLAAMVIMVIGLLGLLQSVNIATEHNLKNQMRNEVARIAQDNMNAMRSRPFDAVSTATQTLTAKTQLRNIDRDYLVRRKRFNVNDKSAKYQVDVQWKYKNVSTTYSVMTVRSRADE